MLCNGPTWVWLRSWLVMSVFKTQPRSPDSSRLTYFHGFNESVFSPYLNKICHNLYQRSIRPVLPDLSILKIFNLQLGYHPEVSIQNFKFSYKFLVMLFRVANLQHSEFIVLDFSYLFNCDKFYRVFFIYDSLICSQTDR